MAPPAAAVPADRDRSEADRCVVVAVGGERLALPAADVVEVLRPRRLSRVPHAPEALLGVASLRGAVLPVLSLARLRGTDDRTSATSPRARLVVIAGPQPFALLVDDVAGFGDGARLPRIEAVELASRALRPARPDAAARPDAGSTAPARPREAAAPERAVLAFTVAGQLFGLDLGDVVEVAPMPARPDAVPDAGAAMLGLASRRGRLLPLVSAGALLGRSEAAPARMVVVRVAGADLGLAVDAVEAILRVPAEDVEPLPPLLARGGGEARVVAVCRLEGGKRLMSLLSAARLFDDDGMRRARAAAPPGHDATGNEAMTTTDEAERFLVFDLGGEAYALPIAAVDEVVRLPDALTRVPRAPAFVEGVMNLRGVAVPVLDLGRRFGAASAPGGPRRRVVVVEIGGLKTGLLVDGASEVLSAAPAEVLPAPNVAADGAGTFDRVVSIARDGRLVLVVSPAALLAEAERDLLAAMAAASGGAAPEGAAP